MRKLLNGISAGFAATLVLSVFMVMKMLMGIAPQFNPIMDLTNLAGTYGLPAIPLMGWILHFAIGSIVWGGLFAIFSMIFSGVPSWLAGLIFGLIAWLLMMTVFLPMSGHQAFAKDLGQQVLVMTFVLHVIFGLVLGITYGRLQR